MTALSAPPRAEDLAPASPAATRFRRPGWRDPRLAVGVLLVCVSVVLGAELLGARDDVTQVWATRAGMAAGETLSPDDLRPVGVRFVDETDAAAYVSASDTVPEDTVVTRDLTPGELLPLAALGRGAEGLLEVPVAVPGGGVPLGLTAGDRVDLWVVPMARAASRAPRGERVLEDVPVLRVGGRELGGPEASRQVVVGVDASTDLTAAVGQLADSHVVMVRRS
jgi:hypothetical protein